MGKSISVKTQSYMFERFLYTPKGFMALSLISNDLIRVLAQYLKGWHCFLWNSYLIKYLQIILFPLTQISSQ